MMTHMQSDVPMVAEKCWDFDGQGDPTRVIRAMSHCVLVTLIELPLAPMLRSGLAGHKGPREKPKDTNDTRKQIADNRALR
jgi:hypothetical protein